jgi:AcrR family transcriptional regulator
MVPISTKARKVNADNRRRLLDGLAESLREKGLQGTQIGDIVRHARTSKRTFYECFPDKESAFVELIREWSVGILANVEIAIDAQAPWAEQVDQAIDTYVGALTDDPMVTMTVSRDLPTLGARGAALQREGIDRFAALMVRITRRPEAKSEGIKPVSDTAAVMLIGGIAELLARASQDGTPLSDVAETAKTVIKAAIGPG